MTVIDPNLAALCLAVLDGEKDLNPILADHLEEMGERRSEELRALQSTLQINGCTFSLQIKNPLDVVLNALPEEICWHLVCDFAEHVLPIWNERVPGNRAPLQAITARRQWLEGLVSYEELELGRKTCWDTSRELLRNNLLSPRDQKRLRTNAAGYACRAAARGGDWRLAFRTTRDDAQQAKGFAAQGLHWDWKSFLEAIEAERQWQMNGLRQYLLGEAPWNFTL